MIPTLDELIDRLRQADGMSNSLRDFYREVAAGERPPIIRDSVAIFAAQAMSILFNHLDRIIIVSSVTLSDDGDGLFFVDATTERGLVYRYTVMGRTPHALQHVDACRLAKEVVGLAVDEMCWRQILGD